MMLLWLALVVIVLTGILWWLKDHYGHLKLERFAGPEPEIDDKIKLAYVNLPAENQVQARATEIITPGVIDANYRTVAEQRDAALRTVEKVVTAEMDRVAAMDPRVPEREMTERINRNPGMVTFDPKISVTEQIELAKRSPEVVAAEAADIQKKKLDAFEQLLETTEASGKDVCFEQLCTPIQAEIEAKCSQLKERCFYTNNYAITQCLELANDGCHSERVDTCRALCDSNIQKRNQRTILKEGEVLTTNQRLQSVSGSTVLILRDTGNLELYEKGTLLWSSRSNPSSGASTIDQNPYTLSISSAGEMVIRNALNIEIWNTNSIQNAISESDIMGNLSDIFSGPFQCVVAEGKVVLLNRNGVILWKKPEG